jgi:hypothetical protein
MIIFIRLEIPKLIKSLNGIIVQRNVVRDLDGVTQPTTNQGVEQSSFLNLDFIGRCELSR